MKPGNAFTKTGKTVLDMFRLKQPEARAPSATSLNAYPDRPQELVPADLEEDTYI